MKVISSTSWPGLKCSLQFLPFLSFCFLLKNSIKLVPWFLSEVGELTLLFNSGLVVLSEAQRIYFPQLL